VVAFLKVTERLGIDLPIKAEQILRLNENKAFPHSKAAATLGYAPMAFKQGIQQEVALFRSSSDGLSC
jgi:hypothetical protein